MGWGRNVSTRGIISYRGINLGMSSIEELEGKLYELTLSAIIERLNSPDHNAADVNAARSFMKDHNIQGGGTTVAGDGDTPYDLPTFTEKGREIEDTGSNEGTDG